MEIVLLPGLDGTGNLFKPILEELETSLKVKVIKYPNKKLSYKELISYVVKKLPSKEFILLAESFSGYIAYEIALLKPKNLKHIILVATFLKNPRPLLINLIFSKYILLLPIPKFIIKRVFLSTFIPNKTIELFKSAIKSVSYEVLYFRIKQIKNLNPKLQQIEIFATYIQATNDYLVTKNAIKQWQKVFRNLKIYKVNGGHLILQSNPTKCAKIINKIALELKQKA